MTRDRTLAYAFAVFDDLRRQQDQPFGASGCDSLGVTWRRPDNLLFGELGQLFFLLELHACTHDGEALQLLRHLLARIEDQCARQSTYNYSFFDGRMGLVYLYVCLFRDLSEEEYLQKALALTQLHSNQFAQQFMLSGSAGLYQGIAGMLVVLVHLFAASGAPGLLGTIEQYASALVAGARLQQKGIGWEGRPGMAYGASGCAFVMLLLGRFFGNDAFFQLAGEALAFDEHCLQKRGADPQLQGQAWTVIAGAELALLKIYSGGLQQKDAQGDHEALEKHIRKAAALPLGSGLYFGWAGAGLIALEAQRLTGEERYNALAEQLAENLLVQADARAGNTLADGAPGNAYFLLNLLQKDRGSLLFPVVAGNSSQAIRTSFDSILLSGLPELAKPIFVKALPCTFARLEKKLAEPLQDFAGQEHPASLAHFFDHLGSYVEIRVAGGDDELRKCFDKDLFVLQLNDTLDTGAVDAGEEREWKDTIDLLLLDDALFNRLAFVHRPGLRIYDPEPLADLDGTLDATAMAALFTDYGKDAIACIPSSARAPECVTLGADKLVFDLFAQPCFADWAGNCITRFLLAQQPAVVAMMQAHLGAESSGQLPQKIGDLVTRVVRYYFMEGLLMPVGEETAGSYQ